MRATLVWCWQTIGIVFVLSLQAVSPSTCIAAASLDVTPDSIHIGAFYDATQVEISAVIPQGCDAVVEVLGKDIEEQLLRKGRHWDIWMNVGEIDIEGAPYVYFAMSSDPESLSRTDPEAAFGYRVLEQRVSFLGDVAGLSQAEIFAEFVMLKESEKLYRVDPGTLHVRPEPGVGTMVHGVITIPSRIPPETYRVLLSVLRDGRVVESRCASLEVHVVGVPALLSGLARQHGALHGLLAVTVAVAFGYLTGVVFKKSRRGSPSEAANTSAREGKKG